GKARRKARKATGQRALTGGHTGALRGLTSGAAAVGSLVALHHDGENDVFFAAEMLEERSLI
ncbi:MAG: hypothetical protein ACRES6_03960, partial [Steroidobacteraceae bacterium]